MSRRRRCVNVRIVWMSSWSGSQHSSFSHCGKPPTSVSDAGVCARVVAALVARRKCAGMTKAVRYHQLLALTIAKGPARTSMVHSRFDSTFAAKILP